MSSAETCSPPSTGPISMSSSDGSSGPSTGTGSTQSQMSSFDTQPLSSQDEPNVCSQAWGQLMVVGDATSYDLVNEKYVVGRDRNCDIVLVDKTKPTFASSLWKACSKRHFRLYTETKSTGRFVFIEDLSTNGTIVNRALVGSKKFTVIKSGDIISLVKNDYKAFLYIDFGAKDENDGVPPEVKLKYMFIKDLGRGAFGEVKLAICKDDKGMLAVKCIVKKAIAFTETKKDLMKEVRIITKLNHPCVIKIKDVMDTPEMLCIFMELVEGGDLFKMIRTQGRLDADHARMIIYQTCLAVQHLHENNVVHRDLKPENILLSSMTEENQLVKVTDFGYSCVMNSSSLLQSMCGTPYYIAPEIVSTNGLGKTSGYTKAVDCWSLGVILFVCITGQPAFDSERDDGLGLVEQILKGDYVLKDKYWEHLPQAKELVQQLLVVDPSKRPTVDEILKYSWFENVEMLSRVSRILGAEGLDFKHSVLDASPDKSAKRQRTGDVKENFCSQSNTPTLQSKVSINISPPESGATVLSQTDKQ